MWRPPAKLQGMPCDDVAPLGVIECGKQDLPRVGSTCSTYCASSASDKEGSDTESSVKLCGKSESEKQDRPQCSTDASANDTERFEGGNVDRNEKKLDMKCMGMGIVEDAFVGANISGQFRCSDCSQVFDTDKALSLHCKFMHDSGNASTAKDAGYTLIYEFDHSKLIDS